MGPADSLGSDWKIMFIPNDNDFDPARPTMKDLENAIDISSAVTWDPITFTYDKEEDMSKFQEGQKVRYNALAPGHIRGEEGVISRVVQGGQFDYTVRVASGIYYAHHFELEALPSWNFKPSKLKDQSDVVNHPSHYTSDPSGVECITITRHRNFNIGNAIKYLWRNGLKDSVGKDKTAKQIEDLKKAVFYINDEIKRLGGTP